jgi:hypothetical protein
MGTYRGTVRVENPDGEEIDVEANLESRTEPGGEDSWDGTMVGRANWIDLRGKVVPIRIHHRTGTFRIARAEEIANPLATVFITGEGPAPFD